LPAIPVLMAASRENADDEDDTISAARSQRLQGIVEAYIALLAQTNDNATGEVALETFALTDSIRGQNVQKALSASSARSVAKDPGLADLVREEQDFGKQINAQLGALNNALSSNAFNGASWCFSRRRPWQPDACPKVQASAFLPSDATHLSRYAETDRSR
jgi:hypothetical protein